MMLLRARTRPEVREEFDCWFDVVHMANVRGIPGIARALAGRANGGTRLGVYLLNDAEAIEPALSSPEAAYTRGTWTRWQDDMEEMTLELWAEVVSMPLFEEIN